MTTDQPTQMAIRLKTEEYSVKDCAAAINAEHVPNALGQPLSRMCVIRGIRHHDGYAHELRGVAPEFTRAMDAREIMSDRVPEISSDDDIPYCIWHPQIASEHTYREVARKYPEMAYQVGRACAVAGYTALYQELHLLPDIHIAEEARESGSSAILEDIMSKPTKYNIMNDYDRSVNIERLAEAYMNGDTAVRSSLDIKQKFSEARVREFDEDGEESAWFSLFEDDGYRENTFNITEDMNIDVVTSAEIDHDATHSELLVELLTGPLPRELPTVDKDLLIMMAAYCGDIDRYVRLRRPTVIHGEIHSCVHGIYHNTMFAVWCVEARKRPSQNR